MKTMAALSLILLMGFTHAGPDNYMFIVLKPIPACDGKCNNFELTEHQRKTAEDCQKLEDSCKITYPEKTTYYTIAPGEAAIYYKYNKFVAYCDCKVLGVYKSTSIEAAKEEMNKMVEEARVKHPKAYHNYEVYKTWPR